MTINEQIEFDVTCLKGYFKNLFLMAEEASKNKPLILESDEDVERFAQHSVTEFIRPDMACNIYSLVDFWLAKLCLFYECNNNLPLCYKDVKGKSQLHAYHKYLTKVAMLNLQSVTSNFEHLDSLRKVRNYLIHSGAHVEEYQQREIANIHGISVVGSLIVLSDAFIWESLENAKTYLCAVARA